MQFTNNFQISGHETFVLRKLWLPKVFRYVKTAIDSGITPSFSGEAPIVELGLGKNMLSSAKFWSIATGMLTKKDLHPTQLANFLFGENGADPHCSSLTTQWLIHWNLTSAPSSLTIFWFLFNQVNMYPAHLKEQEFPFRGTTLICSEYRCRPVLKISSTFQEIRFKNQGFMKTVSLLNLIH